MATTFDGPNKLIILEVPVTNILEVDVRSLYSDWKRWLKTGDNAKYLPAFRVLGGDPLTPGINAGSYFFLQNQIGWRIRAGAKNQTIYYVGNLVPEDAQEEVVIDTPGFTVAHIGLQPITQNVEQILISQQSTSFDGVVAYDENAINTLGTSYPAGTRTKPVNNTNDLFAIAAREGITAVSFKGHLTLDRNVSGFSFVGVGTLSNDMLSLNNQNVSGCSFLKTTIDGTKAISIIPTEFTHCSIGNLSNADGTFEACDFRGTITFQPNSYILMNSCFSGIPGITSPIFDFANSEALSISVRDWNGGIMYRNITDVGFVGTLGISVGNPTIENTCTAGILVLRGKGQNTTTINPNGTNVIYAGMEFPELDRNSRNKILKAIQNIPPI